MVRPVIRVFIMYYTPLISIKHLHYNISDRIFQALFTDHKNFICYMSFKNQIKSYKWFCLYRMNDIFILKKCIFTFHVLSTKIHLLPFLFIELSSQSLTKRRNQHQNLPSRPAQRCSESSREPETQVALYRLIKTIPFIYGIFYYTEPSHNICVDTTPDNASFPVLESEATRRIVAIIDRDNDVGLMYQLGHIVQIHQCNKNHVIPMTKFGCYGTCNSR